MNMKNRIITIILICVVVLMFGGCVIDIDPSVANTQFGM